MEPNINKQVYKTGILIVALVIISISCEKDELFRIPEVDGFTSALQSFDRDQNIIRPLDFYFEALKYDFSYELDIEIYREGYEEYLTLQNDKTICH